MSENLKLCMGCMNPLDEEGKCSYCDYDETSPHFPSYLAPNTVLNERYVVGKVMSFNGESVNYIGYDLVTNSKVQIKEYMPDTLCHRNKDESQIEVNAKCLAQYKTYMSEFEELNRTLSRMRTLSHIVPVLDIFTGNNTTYVIFEYIESVTLNQFVHEHGGELSWEQIQKFFPPLFTTLSLVHNAGIVHRGISLDTILISSKGELKISGFAISALRTANTNIVSELAAGFAAPEQYSSREWQGTWTDVYALSSLLYRLMTGCVPSEAVSRIGNDDLVEPSQINRNIPTHVSKVLMQGLEISSELRIQTVTELVTKLFERPNFVETSVPHGATQTIPIVKTKNEELKEEKENWMTAVIIGVLGVTIILVVVIILLLSLFGSNNNGVTKPSGTIPSTSVTPPTTTAPPITSTTPPTTTTTNPGTMFSMPNLVGQNYELIKNVESITSRITFVIEYEYNADVEKDFIFFQSVEKGTDVYPGVECLIIVSRGPTEVEVPDYYANTVKEYIEKLDELSIKYEVKQEETSEYADGYVIRTSKDIGDKISVANGEVLIVYQAKYVEPTASTTTTENNTETPEE